MLQWDYLIVTAANDQQAASYRSQIQTRRKLAYLSQVREVLVVPDAGGQRVGSGGSTLQCIREVLDREAAADNAEATLRRLRILIVHAGGDSRRLPAYSPRGKIFVPLPGEARSGLTPTLFDRLVPAFLSLPPGPPGAGQIVIAAGDALILFDPSEVGFSREGLTALGARVSPQEAARHGVLCPNPDGSVRIYLQKPDVAEQRKMGAIDDGCTVLDIGIMSLDAAAAAKFLRAFGSPASQAAMLAQGIDLYREICCALGTQTTFPHYLAAARSSGSKIAEPLLAEWFDQLTTIPLNLQTLSRCDFLHFGSTRQLVSSGIELITRDCGSPPSETIVAINNDVHPPGRVQGSHCWVEGCRIRAPLVLHRDNVIVGVAVNEPFELPEGGCLDVTSGLDRHGQNVHFIRYYGIDDTFKGATFCGRPLTEWLKSAGISHAEIWSTDTPEDQRTLWNARVFPAEKDPGAFRQWLWMLDADHARDEQKRVFLSADRYSSAEIALLAK
jgi:fucokinase